MDEQARYALAHQVLARARRGVPAGMEVAVFVFATDTPEDFTVASTGAEGAHARLRSAVQAWLRPSRHGLRSPDDDDQNPRA